MSAAATGQCYSCDRDHDTSLLVVLDIGPPRPVCASCFGAMLLRVNLSAACGCPGCQALSGALTDLLAQAENGQDLPMAANPQAPHSAGRCLLWPDVDA